MKKRALLFIPIVLSVIPLSGCKDYKFDDPGAVIRNRTNTKQGVLLTYGYESNASPLKNNRIRDFNNVVISNLEKATFEKGRHTVSQTTRCIEFSLGSYYAHESTGVANFKLYDNGYITYTYPYWTEGKAKVDTFHFTFDPSLAESIVDQVYEEFDIAKAEEERFIATFTLDNFFKTIKNQKSSVWLRSEDRKDKNGYFDNGEILEELKKLEYTPFTSESEKIDRGFWDVQYSDYPGSYSGRFAYKGGNVNWNLLIGRRGEDSRWAYMSLFGEDKYEKDYSLYAAYDLKTEQADSLIENARKISAGLEKAPTE